MLVWSNYIVSIWRTAGFPQPSNAQRYMCPPCINRTLYNFIVTSLICFRCWEFRSSGEDYKNSPGRSPKLQNSQEFARAAGVGLGECKARTAKQPQGPERKQLNEVAYHRWVITQRFSNYFSLDLSALSASLREIKIWNVTEGFTH